MRVRATALNSQVVFFQFYLESGLFSVYIQLSKLQLETETDKLNANPATIHTYIQNYQQQH